MRYNFNGTTVSLLRHLTIPSILATNFRDKNNHGDIDTEYDWPMDGYGTSGAGEL